MSSTKFKAPREQKDVGEQKLKHMLQNVQRIHKVID